jgi:hypothetical protein
MARQPMDAPTYHQQTNETVIIAGLPVRIFDPAQVIRDRDKPVTPGIVVPPMYAERLGLKSRSR